MAIIRCAECKSKVSDKATSCPKCGAPIVIPEKKKRAVSGCGCLALLIIIGGMLYVLSQSNDGTSRSSSSTSATVVTSQSGLSEKQRKEVFNKVQLLSLQAEKEAIAINPLDASEGLAIDEVFQLTKQTPLMSGIPDKDYSTSIEAKPIPAGYFIKIQSIQGHKGSTLYEVAVADHNRKLWGTGYINNTALIGQRKPGALSPQDTLMRQNDISDRIFSRYEQDLLREYNITTNDLRAISVEAVEKGWIGK
jgi:DNA-directed RNA polymerase subunit RPC12/RpoP